MPKKEKKKKNLLESCNKLKANIILVVSLLPTQFVWACPTHKTVDALHASVLTLTKSDL